MLDNAAFKDLATEPLTLGAKRRALRHVMDRHGLSDAIDRKAIAYKS